VYSSSSPRANDFVPGATIDAWERGVSKKKDTRPGIHEVPQFMMLGVKILVIMLAGVQF